MFTACESTLADVIPQGSSLTIWATIDGGLTFYRKVYVGTGRLVA
ncbi:hypothetical protein GCM10010532_041810 [Dactylosporangium siamense]|uniref:Uncharacterized protein n=1 Tax=Dactylosporangium siamense TaxID=685454 RepID=A0A919UBU4_9ACTN|nr:hypothetical protein Dsi01nite_030390 [Dactylosporangium siamense]